MSRNGPPQEHSKERHGDDVYVASQDSPKFSFNYANFCSSTRAMLLYYACVSPYMYIYNNYYIYQLLKLIQWLHMWMGELRA